MRIIYEGVAFHSQRDTILSYKYLHENIFVLTQVNRGKDVVYRMAIVYQTSNGKILNISDINTVCFWRLKKLK